MNSELSRRWSGLLQASEGAGVGPDLPTRSLIFDCIVAATFFGCGSVFLPLFYDQAGPIDYLFVGLVNLPLVLRRRLPRTSFLMIQCSAFAQIWMFSPIGLHDGGMLFSFYSLVGFTNRRTGLLGWIPVGICALSGAYTDWWNFIDESLMGDGAGFFTRIATTAGMLVLAFASWASGERLRSARLGQVALAARASQLERDREQQAELAAAAERARIAREMHDVIAHALSVMIAQADGGAYVIDQSPAEAKKSLQSISATGRDSLTQMRTLLGLLREGMDDDQRQSTPQPGLDQLDQLIADAERVGMHVELIRNGDLSTVADLVGLTLYRIVQECLTNARKHGGDQVRVKIDITGKGIDLEVSNGAPDGHKRLQTGEPGHGIRGMQERATAVGGRLTAGAESGGYVVRAWVPRDPATV